MLDTNSQLVQPPEPPPAATETAPRHDFDAMPSALKVLRRWVAWRLELRQGKLTKIPYAPAGSGYASVTNPATWGTFEQARQSYLQGGYSGIGFVFTEADGVVGVDLDNCRDPESGTLHPWAQQCVEQLSTYTEYSQSGRGVHMLFFGALPGDRRRITVNGIGVEIYNHERYFVMTGRRVPGTSPVMEERTSQLASLYESCFGAIPDSRPASGESRAPAPREDTGGNARPLRFTDEEVLTRARRAKNAKKFNALYEGRSDDSSDAYDSPSQGDLALCCILAFHSQGNAEQIDRLFRQSKLYRPKWDERRGERTYGEMAVSKAIELERAREYEDRSQDIDAALDIGGPESVHGDPVRVTGNLAPADGRGPFNVHTAGSLRTRVQELGKTEYIVEGLIPQQSLVAAIGDSGKGKTPLFYQLIVCVVTGKPFLGRKTKQGRVLYLDFENGLAQVLAMVERLTLHIGATLPVDDFLVWNLNDAPESWGEAGCTVFDLIRHFRPSLVVIDPLSAPFPEVDEKNGDVNRLIKKFRLLMKEIGCSLVLIHHLKKPSDAEGAAKYSLEYGDVQQWFVQARGPRSLITATDVRLGIDTPHSSDGEVALVMGGYTRLQGPLPMLKMKRVYDDAGDPMGYDLLTGANLLLQPLRDAYMKLPPQFRHKDAAQILKKAGGALSRDLDKLAAAGLIRKTAAGYGKVVTED